MHPQYTASTGHCSKQLGRPASEREQMPQDKHCPGLIEPATVAVAGGKNSTTFYSLLHLWLVGYTLIPQIHARAWHEPWGNPPASQEQIMLK